MLPPDKKRIEMAASSRGRSSIQGPLIHFIKYIFEET